MRLCIQDWPASVLAPGPGFVYSKLGQLELDALLGPKRVEEALKGWIKNGNVLDSDDEGGEDVPEGFRVGPSTQLYKDVKILPWTNSA